MNNIVPLIGRIFLTFLFLWSGINKIPNFSGTQQYMEMNGMPLTALFLVAAIVIEILGALFIMFGFKTKLAALVLIVFLIPTTLIFHTNFADQMQVIQFMKNLSVIGGLLMVMAYGAGTISLDAKGKA